MPFKEGGNVTCVTTTPPGCKSAKTRDKDLAHATTVWERAMRCCRAACVLCFWVRDLASQPPLSCLASSRNSSLPTCSSPASLFGKTQQYAGMIALRFFSSHYSVKSYMEIHHSPNFLLRTQLLVMEVHCGKSDWRTIFQSIISFPHSKAFRQTYDTYSINNYSVNKNAIVRMYYRLRVLLTLKTHSDSVSDCKY